MVDSHVLLKQLPFTQLQQVSLLVLLKQHNTQLQVNAGDGLNLQDTSKDSHHRICTYGIGLYKAVRTGPVCPAMARPLFGLFLLCLILCSFQAVHISTTHQ